jgi:hypothetical protein
MTPRDIDALTSTEYQALWEYAEQDARDHDRQARQAARRRR